VLQKVHLIYAPCFTQVYKLSKTCWNPIVENPVDRK
jgi:hypothetical protein